MFFGRIKKKLIRRSRLGIENTTPSDVSTSIFSILQKIENVKNSFTVDEPVEQVRDLVTVHNINEEKLMKSLRLGGLETSLNIINNFKMLLICN